MRFRRHIALEAHIALVEARLEAQGQLAEEPVVHNLVVEVVRHIRLELAAERLGVEQAQLDVVAEEQQHVAVVAERSLVVEVVRSQLAEERSRLVAHNFVDSRLDYHRYFAAAVNRASPCFRR